MAWIFNDVMICEPSYIRKYKVHGHWHETWKFAKFEVLKCNKNFNIQWKTVLLFEKGKYVIPILWDIRFISTYIYVDVYRHCLCLYHYLYLYLHLYLPISMSICIYMDIYIYISIYMCLPLPVPLSPYLSIYWYL
jgi:hypothetical protein